MVFAAPALALAVAEGIEVARRWLRRGRPWAPAAFLTLLLAPGVAASVYHIFDVRRRHEVRPVIDFLREHQVSGDQLLVFDPATFAFYTGLDMRGATVEPDPGARVWVIVSGSGFKPLPVEDVLARLRARRPQLGVLRTYGAATYLFGPERHAPDARPP